MTDSPLAAAHQHLVSAVEELSAVGVGATNGELLSVLTLCEGVARRLDQLTVTTIAALERRGSFTERGYRNA
ncbi:MAG: hypothetical protein L0K86_25735, partial [Actinomycetia bacterium]|nr:hypothetical protein [Actinomycetes bacterium]